MKDILELNCNNIFKKKGGKKLIVFMFIGFGLIISSIFSCHIAFASTQNMNWHQKGQKNVSNSYIYTEFNGVVSATSGSKFLWWGNEDSIICKGKSTTKWLGSNPFNADSITQTDTIWINGSGQPSYSAGISAGSSGAEGSLSISSISSGEKNSYSYSLSNKWYVNVDYSYSGNIWSWSYVGQKSSGTVLLGNTFYLVDSEANQILDYRSDCWFS